MTKISGDFCRAALTLTIVSLNDLPNMLAMSIRLVSSHKITSMDLCKILLKLFQSDFEFPLFTTTIV